MSTHFSANQYDQAFNATHLQNWQVPQRYKERPSTLEGFTRIISNDRGHILEGIPRSSKSPWGEFVGTWDMQRPALRTKTLKNQTMVENMQEKEIDILIGNRTPSPTKARTPSPTKMRTPSPKQAKWASPVMDQARTPSPTKMRTPTPHCASPAPAPGTPTARKSVSPTHGSPRQTPQYPSPRGTPVNRKSPVLEAE